MEKRGYGLAMGISLGFLHFAHYLHIIRVVFLFLDAKVEFFSSVTLAILCEWE